MGLKKRLINDNSGGVPIIAWIAVLVIGGIGTYIAVENLTQQPNIIYNVSESPFSFFGNQVDWIWIILIAVGVIFVLIWGFARSGKNKNRQIQPYYRNGRN